MKEAKKTSFQTIYSAFLSLITDDMYLEWNEDETYADIKQIMFSALTRFQFPRFNIENYTEANDILDIITEEVVDPDTGEVTVVETKIYAEEDCFNTKLTLEEVNIIANLMVVEWLNRQLASIEVVRQAYSSRDFEFTSQANHLDKLIKLKESYLKDTMRLQRLYGRRKRVNGLYVPNYEGFGGK